MQNFNCLIKCNCKNLNVVCVHSEFIFLYLYICICVLVIVKYICIHVPVIVYGTETNNKLMTNDYFVLVMSYCD